MQLSPLSTIRCLIKGHKFETLLIRCNGAHLICHYCGMEIWRPVSPNDGDVIKTIKREAV